MTGQEVWIRDQLLQAVRRLCAEGLIERTWGNISARVSDTQFLITPSGLAYEALRADQLVLVNIGDCSYEGSIKPSSEKGIHADAYRLRPEINFVIHTHQFWASVVGIEGRAVTGFIHPQLGKRIPCAAYGLPGTRKLRQSVEAEVSAWPDCQAFLLRRHGALCLGKNRADAFDTARALEEVSEARVREQLRTPPETPAQTSFGSSQRRGDAFLLTLDGVRRSYYIESAALSPAAALHAAVYRAGNFQYIVHETSPEVLAVSAQVHRLRPYLDDLAQIAGADLLCVPAEPRHIANAVQGRSAVLLQGAGAFCAGGTKSDAEAVCALLRKGCTAWLYAKEIPRCHPLTGADARLQRLVYRQSYRKKKDSC